MDELFDGVVENVPTVDDSIDYVNELVGEGRKFKTVSDMAKGKVLADQYIEDLKRKLDAANQELNKRQSLEEFKTEIEALRRQAADPAPRIDPPVNTEANKVDASNIKSVLDELLTEREARRAAETNLERVDRVFKEQLGDQAKIALQNKAKELGMSVQDLKAIAVRSPDALFRLVGLTDAPRQPVAPAVPQSTVGIRSNAPVGGARGASYYERLRQSDPKKYFTYEIEKQMTFDMQTLGIEKFNAS